jgi:hypothetical protein
MRLLPMNGSTALDLGDIGPLRIEFSVATPN